MIIFKYEDCSVIKSINVQIVYHGNMLTLIIHCQYKDQYLCDFSEKSNSSNSTMTSEDLVFKQFITLNKIQKLIIISHYL